MEHELPTRSPLDDGAAMAATVLIAPVTADGVHDVADVDDHVAVAVALVTNSSTWNWRSNPKQRVNTVWILH